jgi:peptide/nickel transport system permease protein
MLVPLSLGVTLIAFLVTNTIPGDPVLALVGDRTAAQNPQALEEYRHAWGFDQPLPIRYWIYLEHLVHGDLGISIMTRLPVSFDLGYYFPATAELAILAIAFALIVGIPVGVLGAIKHGSIVDYVAQLIALLSTSIPIFWLALIAIQLFFVQLQIATSVGRLDVTLDPPQHITGLYTVDSILTGNWVVFWNALAHLVLPSMVLGVHTLALISRMVRASLLQTLSSNYVRTARSKGLSEWRVVQRHALRNALIPTVTITGLVFAQLLGGAVLTETIFAWPGLGRYAASAAANLDFNAIMGVSLLVAFIVIVANLIVDVAYAMLDPRIKYA